MLCVSSLTTRGWSGACRLVGSCVLPGENFCTYITSFARLTPSRAILQSIAFSSLSDQWELHFFHISKPFFIQSYRFLYHGDQKISWWSICRWRAVNFEIHPCRSGVISDCIWRSTSIWCVLTQRQRELWPRKWFLFARCPSRWAYRSM